MNQHTPEPWILDAACVAAESDQLNNGFYAAICQGPDRCGNARRIVACVNACEGISTEDLEAVPRLGLLNLSKFSSDLIAQRDHAEAQVRHFQERLAVFQAQFSMAKALIHDLRTPVETGLHNAKVMRCELGVQKRENELRRIEKILSWKEAD